MIRVESEAISSDNKPKILAFSLREKSTWLVILALFQVLSCSGLVWGWNALKSMLIVKGSFSTEELVVIYNCGITGAYVANVPFGFTYDFYGPKTASLCAAVCLAIGCFLMTIDRLLGFSVGYFLLSMAGAGVQISAFTTFEAYPNLRGVLMPLSTAAFELSSLTFLYFQMLFTAGTDFNTLFFGYLLVPSFIFVSSGIFWRGKSTDTNSKSTSIVNDVDGVDFYGLGMQSAVANENSRWQDEVTTPGFIFVCLCNSFQVMRVNWAVGGLGTHIYAVYPDADEAKEMLDTFAVLFALGFLIAIPYGTWLHTKGPFGLLLGGCIACTVAQAGMLCLQWKFLAYCTFVILSVAKQINFTGCASCLMLWFGKERFGRYIGVMKTCAAGAGFINLAWTSLAVSLSDCGMEMEICTPDKAGLAKVNWILLFFMFPFIIVIYLRPPYLFNPKLKFDKEEDDDSLTKPILASPDMGSIL